MFELSRRTLRRRIEEVTEETPLKTVFSLTREKFRIAKRYFDKGDDKKALATVGSLCAFCYRFPHIRSVKGVCTDNKGNPCPVHSECSGDDGLLNSLAKALGKRDKKEASRLFEEVFKYLDETERRVVGE